PTESFGTGVTRTPAFQVNVVSEASGASIAWVRPTMVAKVNRRFESRVTRLACADPPTETFDPSLKAAAAPKIATPNFVSTWSYLWKLLPVERDVPSKKLWLWKSEVRW